MSVLHLVRMVVCFLILLITLSSFSRRCNTIRHIYRSFGALLFMIPMDWEYLYQMITRNFHSNFYTILFALNQQQCFFISLIVSFSFFFVRPHTTMATTYVIFGTLVAIDMAFIVFAISKFIPPDTTIDLQEILEIGGMIGSTIFLVTFYLNIICSLTREFHVNLQRTECKGQEFKMIFQNIEESLLIVNEDGKIKNANDMFIQTFQKILTLQAA
jgi:hypothetical protein